jgi:hypothetical protein
MSHIVQVVSMLEVMMSFGLMVFQSKEVRGAVCSGVLELDNRARGVNFWGGGSRVLTDEDRDIVLLTLAPDDWGNDHNRRWSPDVARRSVDCFWEDGGSHSIRVTG